MKDINYYMNIPYEITVESSPEGGYIAYIPDLKGCITQAETLEELYAMINDAKLCWLETALELGLNIPEPTIETGEYTVQMPISLHQKLKQTADFEGISVNQIILSLLTSGLKSRTRISV